MLLQYDKKSNAFILQKEDLSMLKWRVALEADGMERLGRPCLINENVCNATYKIDCGEAGLEWVLDFNTGFGDKIEITSVIRNIGVKPVSLGKAYMCKAIDISGFGKPEEDIVQLTLPLGQGLRDIQPVKSPDSYRESDVKILLLNRDRQEAVLAGFISFQRALTRVVYEYDEQVGIRNLTAYCDFAGFDLLPGETMETEKFVFAGGADPYRLLEDWSDSVAAVYHPRFIRKPALGWVGWAWVFGNTSESTEEITVGNVEAINKRLNGFGFEYCWISIANLEDGNPGD
ncbi:MAG: hypothetical protein PHT33_07545, partial [bacterium]|nr:hypothetical protein [bacterium]